MKRIVFIFLVLGMNVSNAQSDSLVIKSDSANLLVLFSDFISNRFEGGVIYHLPKSDNDSLHLHSNYQSPSDFGSIEFKHVPSHEIVFKGGIVWDGGGDMEIPKTVVDKEAFSTLNKKIKRPKECKHYKYDEILDSYVLYPKAMAKELSIFQMQKYAKEFEKIKSMDDILDRAWNSIDHLELVKEMIQKKGKVGFYLYTPSVGMFDPTVATWVTFIYLN